MLLNCSVLPFPTNGVAGIDASGFDRSHTPKHYATGADHDHGRAASRNDRYACFGIVEGAWGGDLEKQTRQVSPKQPAKQILTIGFETATGLLEEGTASAGGVTPVVNLRCQRGRRTTNQIRYVRASLWIVSPLLCDLTEPLTWPLKIAAGVATGDRLFSES